MEQRNAELPIGEMDVILHDDNSALFLRDRITHRNYLEIVLPFKTKKLKPNLKDTTKKFERVFAFKNNYFAEYDIVVVRRKRDSEWKTIGYLFRPFIVFESDSNFLFESDITFQHAVFRAIVNLMAGWVPILPKRLDLRMEIDITLQDLYSNDIIVGLFPDEWNPSFDDETFTELLYNLYLKGFIYLTGKEHYTFSPVNNSFQKSELEALIRRKATYKANFDIQVVGPKIKGNKYCSYYIKEIVKEQSNDISKFHQIYSLIELFKDEILKNQLVDNFCSRGLIQSGVSGYKLKQDIARVSLDSHSVTKLFTVYSSGTANNQWLVTYELYHFLKTCRPVEEFSTMDQFPQLLYYLRNSLVHDLKFLFAGEREDVKKLREEFARLVLLLEHVVIEAICTLRV